MATRLYLTSSASASQVENPDGGVFLLSGTKSGAATSVTLSAPSWNAAIVWVTTPLASNWTPVGGLTCCVGISGGGDVDFCLYAVPGLSTVEVGQAVYRSFVSDSTPATAQGWAPPLGISLTDATLVPAGYRLVFWIGNYSGTNTIRYGGTGTTDLTIGNTNVSTRPGWIELADNVSFVGENTATGAAQRGMLAMF